MKKLAIVILAALLLIAATASLATAEEYPALTGETGVYNAGVYEVKVRGMGGYMTFHVTFSPDAIEEIEVVSHTETPNIVTRAIENVIPAILEAQSAEVDAWSGATITSDAIKKAVAQAVEAALAGDAPATGATGAGSYTAGTYEEKVRGMGGYMTVAVTFTEDAIESIEILSHTETPNIGTRAIENVIPAILDAQSAEVDAWSGATITSDAIKKAVAQAIAEASAAE